MPTPDPDPPHSIETRIDNGVLQARFDGGHWLLVDHGARRVESAAVYCSSPIAARISYLNTWGLVVTLGVQLRTPRRLDVTPMR